jgi:anti-sigma-K factor RskA
MIDERHEELASLHALDLLEGSERTRFEAELSRGPALQTLVRELREVSCGLAYCASPVRPPSDLRARVLSSLPARPAADNVVRPSSLLFRKYLPWSLAAGFALGLLWLAQLQLASHAENELLRQQAELASLALQSSNQQLEAERIVRRQQLAMLEQQSSQSQSLLTDTRSQLAERDRRIAQLAQELRAQSDLANLKITALASLLDNSPKALAIAVWNPARQEGVLKVEKLPALLPHQDYQLWVVDPQYPNPVDGGVFTVNAETGEARLPIRARQSVGAINAFAVTLERKGGVPKAEGPFVLLGK